MCEFSAFTCVNGRALAGRLAVGPFTFVNAYVVRAYVRAPEVRGARLVHPEQWSWPVAVVICE